MKKLLSSCIIFICFNASASCPDLYPKVQLPKLENTKELCNSFYVSVYDTKNKAVLFTSEKLTGKNVGSVSRINAFRADSRVNGPKNSDYTNSGYDRGHMVASDDASTTEQMRDTFLLTNMTPQDPTLNRNAWKKLETTIRKQYAKSGVDSHVLTIAVYNTTTKWIGSGIPVPTGYWKIVYSGNTTKYYYANNLPHSQVTNISTVDVINLLKNTSRFTQ